ncbi:unnamed protein product [Pieris brassicae]|uniref:Uncharacterized protein n=1 Tax=Pieris brassicae TaxID=7116 RepID=A0A9P0XEU6_PIEBR|nr:unnamed protein product [Pieris brassicae]
MWVVTVLCALVVTGAGAPNATHRRADPREPLVSEDEDDLVLDYYDEARINISVLISEMRDAQDMKRKQTRF